MKSWHAILLLQSSHHQWKFAWTPWSSASWWSLPSSMSSPMSSTSSSRSSARAIYQTALPGSVNCQVWVFWVSFSASFIRFSPLTNWVIGEPLGLIQQRSYRSLFYERPLWAVPTWAATSSVLHFCVCECVDFSWNQNLHILLVTSWSLVIRSCFRNFICTFEDLIYLHVFWEHREVVHKNCYRKLTVE